MPSQLVPASPPTFIGLPGPNTDSNPRYKCDKNEVPTTLTNGSTLPLVERPEDDIISYDPFKHRKLAHPTSDVDTLIHLLKGSLGSGILAMPVAFKSAGLFFGLFATFFIGAICTYCVHILVKCAHELCRRTQTPSLSFAEVAEAAFLVGPEPVQKYGRLAKFTPRRRRIRRDERHHGRTRAVAEHSNGPVEPAAAGWRHLPARPPAPPPAAGSRPRAASRHSRTSSSRSSSRKSSSRFS